MTLSIKDKEPGRNELCPCKSGLKFKHCHGDAAKRGICNRVANETMVQLIVDEKRKRGMPIELVCPDCNQVPDITVNCTFCNQTGVVTEEQVKEKYEELTKEDGGGQEQIETP